MRLTRRRFALGALSALLMGCRGGGDRAQSASTVPSVPPGTAPPPGPSHSPGTGPPPAVDPGPGVEAQPAPPDPGLSGPPFTLGVASGDPRPDGVVLWTRLAPQPLADGGGVPPVPVTVLWEVAPDASFATLTATGTVETTADDAHTLRVAVGGLRPDRWYAYRFRIGSWVSPTGRTRTSPAADDTSSPLVLAVCSCQNWQSGYYGAYRHLVADGPDVVAWCGDYIYEGPATGGGPRRHDGPEADDLASYRRRYALYRTDADLRAAHAACPWVVTWDDHEVSGDYAADSPGPLGGDADPAAFLERRAAAYRAWWEHMPTRLPRPSGPDLAIYRTVPWGRLASLVVLDGRQYRTPQACGASFATLCPERDEPDRTMLGAEQEAWLADRFRESTAAGTTWTALVNQTLMTALTAPIGPGGAPQGDLDAWDGYPEARRRLLRAAVDAGAANLVAVTGDLHASVVGDLQLDGRTVGTEFVGPGISSSFPADRAGLFGLASLVLSNVHFTDGRHRGYLLCRISPSEWRTTFRWMRSVDQPDSELIEGPTYVVRAGIPGARPA